MVWLRHSGPNNFGKSNSPFLYLNNYANHPHASGFLPGVAAPKDLPVGARVAVKGFDQKHGLMLEKKAQEK
nr:hypothetical protein Josef01_10c16_09 [uncultured archaeon]